MAAIACQLKWNGQSLTLTLPSATLSGAALKAAVAALTAVPVERQKLMCAKAWKLQLKDDAQVTLPGDGSAVITLMGSADTLAKPAEAVKFVEDASRAEVARMGHVLPAGLVNAGNTCYANATLQCLRAIPELREATVATAKAGVPAALGGLFRQLDEAPAAVVPARFLSTLRGTYPKFGEVTPGPAGGFRQQDAEEFASVMLASLAGELRSPTPQLPALLSIPGSEAGPNVVDSLMGLELTEELTCAECAEEPPVTRREGHRKLTAFINDKISHLSDAIKLGLEGDLEKRSEVLGRNAVWKKKLAVTRAPKFVMVQLNRFFFKRTVNESGAAGGENCKILRVVNFPLTNFDVTPFCGGRLADELKARRAAALKAADQAFRNKAAGGGAGAGGAAAGDALFGPGVPADFTGLYDLQGIVTHKGRNSSSGHYVAFVRQSGDKWLAFDDDSVEETTAEYVADRLKGGGDDFMAYLLFYKAKGSA